MRQRLRRASRTTRLAISLVASAGRRELIVILVSTIITSGAIAGQLLVGRQLLDLVAGGDEGSAAQLAPWLVMLGGLLLVAAVSQAIANELRLTLSEKVYRHTMDEILDVATEVGLEAHENADFHDQLQRARLAASSQSSAVVFGLVSIVSTLVVTIGVVAILFTVAPILLPIALLGYVPITLVNLRNNRARYELEVELTELQRERSYVEYVLTDRETAKEVRAFELAPTLRTWHAALWDTRLVRLVSLVRARIKLTSLGSVVSTAVLVGTLSAALVLAARGSISIGDAAVAIVGLQQLSGRLQSAGAAFSSVHEGITFLRDFESFRDALPRIREARPTGRPPSPMNRLSVHDLGYRYPGSDRDAMHGVNFELRVGQVLAIVGANGSGKSTLSKVLCHLLPPGSGRVEWDGVDLAGCDPTAVRDQIAPVFQDFARLMFTLRQDIGLGNAARLGDDAGIRRAATRAGVDSLLKMLPDGIDSRLGKVFRGGTDLSGGQWQRVAIARALFRDARIIVMDEPSASLDPKAETELFDLLQSLATDRIVVFVSHRFATVRSADIVLVMDGGEVVESGSHEQLMAAGGLYRDLFVLQAERYGLAQDG